MKAPVATYRNGSFLFLGIMQQSNNSFSEFMQSRSDQQLLEILGIKRAEYQPLALLAAEEELKRRNIEPDLIQQESRAEPTDLFGRSRQSFEWYHKAGMLLLPFFIGTLFHWLTSLAGSGTSLQFLGFPFLFLCYYLLHQQLKKNGYDQMATDFKHWTSYTLYIYIGLLILGGLLLLIAMMFASHR